MRLYTTRISKSTKTPRSSACGTRRSHNLTSSPSSWWRGKSHSKRALQFYAPVYQDLQSSQSLGGKYVEESTRRYRQCNLQTPQLWCARAATAPSCSTWCMVLPEQPVMPNHVKCRLLYAPVLQEIAIYMCSKKLLCAPNRMFIVSYYCLICCNCVHFILFEVLDIVGLNDKGMNRAMNKLLFYYYELWYILWIQYTVNTLNTVSHFIVPNILFILFCQGNAPAGEL
jgi:hypothetical protein